MTLCHGHDSLSPSLQPSLPPSLPLSSAFLSVILARAHPVQSIQSWSTSNNNRVSCGGYGLGILSAEQSASKTFNFDDHWAVDASLATPTAFDGDFRGHSKVRITFTWISIDVWSGGTISLQVDGTTVWTSSAIHETQNCRCQRQYCNYYGCYYSNYWCWYAPKDSRQEDLA